MTEQGFVYHQDPRGAPLKMWTRGVPVEDQAMQQLRNVAALPFIYHHVAAMPDVHWGMGATVGSVIPTLGAIVPAAVGVDIGCGMMAARTELGASDLPDSLAGIRSSIEAAVPHGRTDNGGPADRGAWGDVPEPIHRALRGCDGGYDFVPVLDLIVSKHPKLARASKRAPHHLGTLGTGNHFIEVCLDAEQRVWVMLHSGSRGIGNAIGSYFIERAKEHMRRWFVNLPDQDLAYLPEGEQDFKDYLEAVGWAQRFAMMNRQVMMAATLCAIGAALGREVDAAVEAVDCHHNYVEREHHFGKNVWVTRKGAVRARQGDLGIIPGSMGARSYIVRGKGNPESFDSCSHGAGRAMSRGEAKRRFTLDDHAAATAGVECRKDAGVIDETPGAYKPIDAVMAAQADLVEVVHELRQVVCVKG
jgi:tRNA-splicing ligase RtcB